MKLNQKLPWQKQENGAFNQQTGLKFKEETTEVPHLEHNIYGAETWTFQK